MPRIDHDLSRLYAFCQEDARAPARLQKIAKATDAATQAMLDSFKESGVRFPGDDRCAVIEHAIFRTAVEADGYTVEGLVSGLLSWADAQ